MAMIAKRIVFAVLCLVLIVVIKVRGEDDYDIDAFEKNIEIMLENALCVNGTPPGHSKTYKDVMYDVELDEALKLMTECLEHKHLEETIREVFNNSSNSKKEKIKKLSWVSFTSLENNLEMRGLIKQCTIEHGIEEQWFWRPLSSHACDGYISATDLTKTPFTTDECFPTWYSLASRSKFYIECLGKFDMNGLIHRGQRAVGRINSIGDFLQKKELERNQKKVGAGAAQVAGSILYGIGVGLAPFTSGTSLALKVFATGLALSGAATSAFLTFADNNEKYVSRAKTEENSLKKDVQKLENLFILYLNAIDHEGNDETNWDWRDKLAFKSVKKQTLSKLKAVFQVTTTSAAWFDTVFTDKVIKEQLSRQVSLTNGGATSAKNAINFQSTKLNGLKMLNNIRHSKNSLTLSIFGQRLVKNGLRFGGQFLTLGFGIWDIMDGTEQLKEAGISSNILLRGKQLQQRLTSLKNEYHEIVGRGPDTVNLEFREETINAIDIYGSHNNKLKVIIISDDRQCTTNVIDTTYTGYSGYYSRGHTRITLDDDYSGNSELGDCATFAINVKNVKVKISKEDNNPLTVSRVDISTNGRIVPALMCNETSPITLSWNWSTISKSSLSCTERQALHRIKIHTSNDDEAGTDSGILLGLTLRSRKTNTVLNECKDYLIDNYFDDREKGQVDHYFKEEFANCKYPLADIADGAYDSNEYEIKVEIESDGRHAAHLWKVDMIKLYFMGIGDKERTIYCHPGNGNGKWISMGKFSFHCELKYSTNDEIALEKLKVKTCDLTYAGSDSSKIQFTFCNVKFTEKELLCAFEEGVCQYDTTKEYVLQHCCRTNKFGSEEDFVRKHTSFIDGSNSDDDGGHELGPCEGFEITGPVVHTYVNNYDTDAWCLNRFWFYAEPKNSIDGQFGYCKFDSTWAESSEVYREGEDEESVYHDLSRINCAIGKKQGIKRISYKVCQKDDAGSSSTFYATIKNGNMDTCTMPLRSNNESYKKNEFIRMDEIPDECKNIIFNGEALVWIHNAPNATETDDLCLTHFYLDLFDSSEATINRIQEARGRKDIKKVTEAEYQCTFNQDADFSVQFNGNDLTGIPLRCKA